MCTETNVFDIAHDKRVKNPASRDTHNAHADETPTDPNKMKKHHKGVQRPLKHEGFEKHTAANTVGKEPKKGGHGKGNWGDEDYNEIAKHRGVDAVTGLLETPVDSEAMIDMNQEEGGEKEASKSDEKKDESKKPLKVNEEEFPSLK